VGALVGPSNSIDPGPDTVHSLPRIWTDERGEKPDPAWVVSSSPSPYKHCVNLNAEVPADPSKCPGPSCHEDPTKSKTG
jgi:hypothetical protein